MRLFLLCLLLCLPACAQDTAKLKRDLNGFFKRMTAMESRLTAVKRPADKAPTSAFEAVDDQLVALEKDWNTLLRELKAWGSRNIPPTGLPGVGQLYNQLLATAEAFGSWMGARRNWAIAGAAQDIKTLAANEAKVGKDYQALRDALAVELKK